MVEGDSGWMEEGIAQYREMLLVTIENMKAELMAAVKEYGMNSPQTLYCSETLDTYIVQYQKLQRDEAKHPAQRAYY